MRMSILRSFGLGLVAIIASIGLFVTPASATVPDGGYADGPIPSVKRQIQACKLVSGQTGKNSQATKYCKKLAKLPSWWINIGGVNYKVQDGPKLVLTTVDREPERNWVSEFKRHIARFNDNHAHISA